MNKQQRGVIVTEANEPSEAALVAAGLSLLESRRERLAAEAAERRKAQSETDVRLDQAA